MTDHPVLAQVVLGYSPMIDRQRAVVATRLTVFPATPEALPNAAELLQALLAVWPGDGAPAKPVLSLNLAGEHLLRDAMAAAQGPGVMIEVPAFMAGDPAHAPALQRLHAAGTSLLLKGRPLAPLPPDLLALFNHCVIEPDEERRHGAAPEGAAARRIDTVVAGLRSGPDFDAAFQRGAAAAFGWPWDENDPPPVSRGKQPSDIQTVLALISGVDKELPVSQLEAVLRRDPTLAYRLMRYLNSPAFGLRVEVNSLDHALRMLGYQRLKRWLAVLLASSAQGSHARPLMFAAVRRGLLMEELGGDKGDAELRGEMFICGVFSLLDRLLQQPFAELLPSLPVPERVQQALNGGAGPHQPFLDLVRAIEGEALYDIRERAEVLMMGPATVNRALLKALHAARELDG